MPISGAAKMAALGFEVLFGALTVTGSFMAFGKLQELITGAPDHLPRPERRSTSTLFAAAIGIFV